MSCTAPTASHWSVCSENGEQNIHIKLYSPESEFRGFHCILCDEMSCLISDRYYLRPEAYFNIVTLYYIYIILYNVGMILGGVGLYYFGGTEGNVQTVFGAEEVVVHFILWFRKYYSWHIMRFQFLHQCLLHDLNIIGQVLFNFLHKID